MSTRSRNSVGDSWRPPVSRRGADVGVRTVRRRESQWSVSPWSGRWDGVNGRSHWHERLRTTGRRRFLVVHRRRCNDRARRSEHQRSASTWSKRWDGTNVRSLWHEDDGGHLRSADRDVATECPLSVLKRPSRTTSTLRLKCTRQSAVHRLKFIVPSRLTEQRVWPGSGSKQQVRPKGRFTTIIYKKNYGRS